MAVALLSPASVVFGLAFAVTPDAWFTGYLHYVAVFVLLAFVTALGGFEVANYYWLMAKRARLAIVARPPEEGRAT